MGSKSVDAPPGGLEPPTYRLTAGRSAIELQGIKDEWRHRFGL